VTLKVAKLRRQTFETAITERYRRRESSVDQALIEMYLAGTSVRPVGDITEALWGTRVSPGTASNLNKKIHGPDRSLAEPADRGRAALSLPRRPKCERLWTTSHRAPESTCQKRSTRIGLSPIVGLSGLCRAPVFGSTYAGGTIEELGAASLELALLRRIGRPKHCPLHVPIRY
jgi:hypothetical protein